MNVTHCAAESYFRIMINADLSVTRGEIQHVYLRGATALPPRLGSIASARERCNIKTVRVVGIAGLFGASIGLALTKQGVDVVPFNAISA
jgi:hypothetical protein